MKLLMLCREPRLYSCQRLKQAAENLGHSMDILDPNKMILKLAEKNFSENRPLFELYYQADQKEKPVLLPTYDAVLPRFGTASTQMGVRVLRHLQAQGVISLNNAQSFIQARDKWHSLQLLVEQGIAVPSSLIAGCEVSAEASVQGATSPIILKTLSGSQGIGVILAEQPQSAVSILETLNEANTPALLQEFVQEAKGTDIRCFVIGEDVVATMQRIGKDGEFRANFHRGGSAEKIQLTDDEKALAVRATKALGLDVAGVDLIRSQNGLLVLEVNASPGLEMIEKTSGVDIALQMMVFLQRKWQNRH